MVNNSDLRATYKPERKRLKDSIGFMNAFLIAIFMVVIVVLFAFSVHYLCVGLEQLQTLVK